LAEFRTAEVNTSTYVNLDRGIRHGYYIVLAQISQNRGTVDKITDIRGDMDKDMITVLVTIVKIITLRYNR
jgi:hypothetical protein